jgi:hypothetical protein
MCVSIHAVNSLFTSRVQALLYYKVISGRKEEKPEFIYQKGSDITM